VQTCALPISAAWELPSDRSSDEDVQVEFLTEQISTGEDQGCQRHDHVEIHPHPGDPERDAEDPRADMVGREDTQALSRVSDGFEVREREATAGRPHEEGDLGPEERKA